LSERSTRVLVLEDDEILRDTLVEVLGDEGHEVLSAANGHVALEMLAAWEPDLIVLDLMMPFMDAHEFRRRQRADGLAAEARVLIVSAARDLAAAADRLGADAWLAKPFRLLEVIEAVDRLVHDRAA
jgi:CheY-like chemotaxis protein